MLQTQPILTVLQHDRDVPLDRFATWLDGVETRVVRLFDGEAVPTLSEAGAGLLVLGGAQNAYDDERAPWLPATRELLAAAVRADLPVLAICLGHQLLAAALGGRVEVAAPPGREVGIVPVTWRPDAASDPVLGPVVRAAQTAGADAPANGVLQPSMHGDAVVELPPGGQWLASSAMYPFQAMRVGSALGVQFHPEASPELLARWAAGHGDDGAALEAEARAHDEHVSVAGRALAQAFASEVRAAAERQAVSTLQA
ncbi:type 1 glutamine amidotransferase [Georgenia sp. AZ-5]|uniref:type 1 glutamine amidotransferase n=1 Tax=Georgenia sp. AZ-5 TaxID=3367526 RepID=UPI003754A1A3